MITFVEYDEQGNIIHICDILTAEGVSAPPEISEPLVEVGETPEERAKNKKDRADLRALRKARIDQIIAERESETRAVLGNKAKTQRLLVLGPNDPRPTHEDHKVDKGKIRVKTQAEKV